MGRILSHIWKIKDVWNHQPAICWVPSASSVNPQTRCIVHVADAKSLVHPRNQKQQNEGTRWYRTPAKLQGIASSSQLHPGFPATKFMRFSLPEGWPQQCYTICGLGFYMFLYVFALLSTKNDDLFRAGLKNSSLGVSPLGLRSSPQFWSSPLTFQPRGTVHNKKERPGVKQPPHLSLLDQFGIVRCRISLNV